MSGRVRVTLADGRRVTGFRKTMNRRFRRPSKDMPPWRLAILLPEALSLVSPGNTSVIGVTIEPDPISGPLAVIEHRNIEWMYQQMGKFLLAISDGSDRILTAVLMREDDQRSQQVVITPDSVEFPRNTMSTITVRR